MHTNGYEHLWTYATRLKGSVQRTQASKSITNEEHKNISPIYECHFSLNRKCENTYFTLIEEQASIKIQLSLSLSYSLIYQREASPLEGSSHPWVKWYSVSHFLPPPLIFIGQEELPRLPWAPPRHQWGGDTWHRAVGAKFVNLPWEGAAGFRVDIRACTWHRL
jgi:hypothetical protein